MDLNDMDQALIPHIIQRTKRGLLCKERCLLLINRPFQSAHRLGLMRCIDGSVLQLRTSLSTRRDVAHAYITDHKWQANLKNV